MAGEYHRAGGEDEANREELRVRDRDNRVGDEEETRVGDEEETRVGDEEETRVGDEEEARVKCEEKNQVGDIEYRLARRSMSSSYAIFCSSCIFRMLPFCCEQTTTRPFFKRATSQINSN